MGNEQGVPVSSTPQYVTPIDWNNPLVSLQSLSSDNSPTYSMRDRPPDMSDGSGVRVAGTEFIVDKLLRQGRFGAVFSAREKVSGKSVALKLVQLPEGHIISKTELLVYITMRDVCVRARKKQMQLGQQQQHRQKNSAEVTEGEGGQDEEEKRVFPCLHGYERFRNGAAVVILDLVGGESLTTAWKSGCVTTLNTCAFASLLLLLAEAMTQLHEFGIVSGSLTPDTVHVFFNKERTQIKRVLVLDYGLSCSSIHLQERPEACPVEEFNPFSADVLRLGCLYKFLILQQEDVLKEFPKMQHKLRKLVSSMTAEKLAGRRTLQSVTIQLRRLLYKRNDVLTVNGMGYKILRRAGQGTYGVVYRVERNGKYFALKVQSSIVAEAGWAACRELEILKEIKNNKTALPSARKSMPRLVNFEQDVVGGETRIVLDFYSRGTLLDYLKDRNDGLTPAKTVRLLLNMVLAVQDLHNIRISHGDIKATNFMMRGSGGQDVVLLDFGLGCSDLLKRNHPGMCKNRYSVKNQPKSMDPLYFTEMGVKDMYLSDVYSLGFVMLKVVQYKVKDFWARQPGMVKRLEECFLQMQHKDPLQRKSLSVVVRGLEHILKDLKKR
jgi:serine/threonine protein kinase